MMRHVHAPRFIILFLLLVCGPPLATLLYSGQTLTVGPWQVTETTDGPGVLTLGGRAISTHAFFSQFRPDYRGTFLTLKGVSAAVISGGKSMVWKKTSPSNGSYAILTLTLTPEFAEYRLEAQTSDNGPCEFGVILDPKGLLDSIGQLQVADEKSTLAEGSTPFPDIAISRFLRLSGENTIFAEKGENSAPVRLQDRRGKNPSELRLMATGNGEIGGTFLAVIRLSHKSPVGSAKNQGTPMEGQPLTFKNGGFAEGTTDWDPFPPNAQVEPDPDGGDPNPVARLTVNNPLNEAVYITRKIPVTGGARYRFSCRVKTSGVQEKPGKKPAIGAGLIIEWGDRGGNWLSAGRVECGLFGDKMWSEKICNGLRAPEEAGFAMVYLALRGSGTAWFDDLAAERLVQKLLPRVPVQDCVLAENKPAFDWHEDVRAAGISLSISKDPKFEENVLILSNLSHGQRPSIPLTPGNWYWRLEAPGYDPSSTFQFRQTSPSDRDTTPPQVERTLFRLTDTQAPLEVSVVEDDPVVTAAATMSNAFLETKVKPVGGKRQQVIISARNGFPRGLSSLDLVIADGQSNKELKQIWLLVVPAPPQPVTIDREGRYRSGERPIFPLGIYQVSPQAMPLVKSNGLEFVHMYKFESDQDNAQARAYLDAVASNGLRAWMGFDRCKQTGKGLIHSDTEHLMARVSALADHPGLFCWYLFDEPELDDQYLSPRALTAYAETIRALDPFHPVVVSTWGPRMNQYRAAWDTHWTQAYEKPVGVLKELDLHRKLTEGKSPLTLLLHVYDKEQSGAFKSGKADISKFQPDPAWLRAAAYSGLTRNINGLFWWMYSDGDKSRLTIKDAPDSWQALGRLTAEMRQLAPFLTDGVDWTSQSIVGYGGTIEIAWKKSGKTRILIAVNTSEKPVSAQIPFGATKPVEVLFENRLMLPDKEVEIFDRFTVHVYRAEME